MTLFRRPSPCVVPGPKLASRRRPRGRFCPRLDVLEGRALLATLTVMNADDAGPGSLRQAILDANAAPGADVVEFAPALSGATITLTGGPLTITDDLTIDGPGADLLTISADGTDQVFVARPAAPPSETTPTIAVTIEGLTLADGRAPAGTDLGGGISAIQTDLTVVDSAFRNNQALAGGALALVSTYYFDSQGNFVVVHGSLTVSDSSFEANNAVLYGGAVAAYDTPTLITDCVFDDNGAGDGGGVYATPFYGTRPTLSIGSSSFIDNDAGGGGAVYVFAVPTTITDTAFRGNTALIGGAVYNSGVTSQPTSLTIEGSTFEGNAAINPASSALGGAISNTGSLIVRGSTFVGNRAVSSGIARGGAIQNSYGAAMTIEDSLFRDNLARSDGASAPAAGGAIGGSFESSITVSGGLFLGNRAEGGAEASGGALQNVGTTSITDSSFLGNTARGRDAAGAFNAGTAHGGAVAHQGGPLTVSGSLFVGNLARGGDGGQSAGSASGGAISSQPDPGQGLTIRATTLLANLARGGSGSSGGDARGGGLFASGIVLVEDSLVAGNRADAGPAGAGYGGGIFLAPGTAATIRRTRVFGNKATTAGDQLFGSFAP